MTKDQAKLRVQVSKLQALAARQHATAAAYLRQASHPIYDGQTAVCHNKATQLQLHAITNRRRADLLKAQLRSTTP